MKYCFFRVLIYYLLSTLFMFACKDDEAPQPTCDGSLQIVVSSIQHTECSTTDGSIQVSVSGGTGNYEFKLDQENFQTSADFTKLSAGIHKITVKDGNNCTADVTAPVLGDLKFADIHPIIESNCAISGCHDGSNSRPDFSQGSTIIFNASNIKSRTIAKTMPPSNASVSLTDEEIAQIACWVDSGAPQ